MKDLYDREITYLRLSVTERCNLRCRYCMPEEGICKKDHGEMLTEDEMIRVVEAAASLGIRKLRITGGEPMVKKNLLSICRRAAAVPGIEEVCMTTNATMLAAPAPAGLSMAGALREAGVHRLNISLDTLDPLKYAWITRRGRLSDALSGIRAGIAAGFDRIKINTVLIGGFNEDEIPALADLTKKYPMYLRFIELMPMSGDKEFGPEAYIPGERVLQMLPDLVSCGAGPELVPEGREQGDKNAAGEPRPEAGGNIARGRIKENRAENTGRTAAHDGVARMYRFPGAPGRIGLISPVQQHFCAECNRIRVTADGMIKPCLHSREELSLKGLDEKGMRDRIAEAILAKPQWHGNLSYSERSRSARPMNRIGG